jgi:glycosyltransferase involved in cell wall biosynthesis
MNPDVSVILPFYNAEQTLNAAIKSIYWQRFTDFECLLIDNNSEDTSLPIAKQWANFDTRFKILHEPRQGVVFASNTGFENAKGRYIARMDADDIAFPDRLAAQADLLNKYQEVDAVGSHVEYESLDFNYKGFRNYIDWVNQVDTFDKIKTNRFIDSPIVNPTAMWRKESACRFGLYQHGDFPEDYEMWLRWLDQGAVITKVPKPLLKWTDSHNRLTRTNPAYSDQAFYKIKTYYLARWLKQHNAFHPRVSVWGASKTSRKRALLLADYDIHIDQYIDTNPQRQLDKKILYYKDLPHAGNLFILVYVRQWKAKTEIKDFLDSRGYTEGTDYLFVS